MKRHSLNRALAVAAFTALPLAALAQSAGTAAPSITAPSGPAPSGAAPSSTAPSKLHANVLLKNTPKNVEAHIAALHEQLQITPAEEGQWSAFAQVMRDNAQAMDAAFTQRGQSLASMNAVQNLQSYAQVSQVQTTNMQKLATAFQTLYASFPPAQQKLADDVFRTARGKHK